MAEKHLHIIALTVPYPVDFGGAFDLFYKLGALQQQGVHIHLHCFDYGRGRQPILHNYCDTVHYYHRDEGLTTAAKKLPYIVASRANTTLLDNLLKDDYPILMEGVHCTYPLIDDRFKHRRKFVRIHNVEYEYYHQLAANESHLIKKVFFYRESKKLEQYERSIVDKATAFWGVTHKDVDIYRKVLHCNTIDYLPLYLPEWKVNAKVGMGTYCLYQADLSISCNDKAARWLLKEVFGPLQIPLVIAGKNPSNNLQMLAHSYPHTCLVANPGELEMQDMIAKAHINVLPSFNNSGIKLKLINALYNGRFCIVNDTMLEGTHLRNACVVANTAKEMQAAIEQLFNQPFSDADIAVRKQLLEAHYSNEANAKQMIQWIWGEA